MAMTTDHRSPQSTRWVPDGVRQDLTWDERIRRHRQAQIPREYPTWQPKSKGAPPVVQLQPAARPAFDPVRPGLLRLYAARAAHAGRERRLEQQPRDDERLLVGEFVHESGEIRTMALVGQIRPVGRGMQTHYDRLHPVINMRYRRLRCGSFPLPARTVAPEATWPTSTSPSPGGWDALWSWWRANTYHPRLGASTRMLVVSCAALVLMLGAATTSFT